MSGRGPLHATALALAVDEDGPLAGVLVLGPAGAGKSSLALASISACPWRRTALVADDAVIIEQKGGDLVARAPERIAGLIEIRGFGPAPARCAASAILRLAIDLGLAASRMPEPQEFRPINETATLPLYPFMWRDAEATAAFRLLASVRSLLSGQIDRRTQDTPGSIWTDDPGKRLQ